MKSQPTTVPAFLATRGARTKTAIFLSSFLAVVTLFSVPASGQLTDDEIAQNLQSKHLVVRWLMLAELEKNGPHTKEMVPLVLKRISHESGIQHELAIRVLGRIGHEAEEAVPELTRLASEGNVDAICALGRIGPNAAPAVPTLEKLLLSDNGGMRVGVAVALWRIDGRPEAMRIIEDAVRQRPTGCSKYFLKQRIAELGPGGKHLILKD